MKRTTSLFYAIFLVFQTALLPASVLNNGYFESGTTGWTHDASFRAVPDKKRNSPSGVTTTIRPRNPSSTRILSATDLLTGKPLPVTGNQIPIEIPPGTFRVIEIIMAPGSADGSSASGKDQRPKAGSFRGRTSCRASPALRAASG